MMRATLPLLLVALPSAVVAQDVPPDMPSGAGPRGTSGEVHDDAIGYAALLSVGRDAPAPAVRFAALHPSLPAGRFVEVTALDSGRTIAVLIVGRFAGNGVVALSPDAAAALGVGDGAAVRVRSVVPSPQEQVALRGGQPGGVRLDAPPALLMALRKRLPMRAAAAGRVQIRHAAAAQPTPSPRPVQTTPARGAYGVQVAALSSRARADALAMQLGGHVLALGRLYRVQLGPFADAASATRARDSAARSGYGDAHIVHSE